MRTLALALVAVTGCSSSYLPQTRGRVAVVMRGGSPAYVRDGQIYEHGILGGGLVDAVHGHPAAVAAATEYHDRMTYGLFGMLGGLGAMLGGTLYAAAEAHPLDERSSNEENVGLGLGLALAGAVVMIVGAAYLGSAEPYRWDAINIFNDAPPLLPPGPPGYATVPKQSLKMRD